MSHALVRTDSTFTGHAGTERAVPPLTQAAFAHATFRTASHGQMVRSKLNVRRKSGNLEELAALIKAHGLLQNLVGFEGARQDRADVQVEIVAGGRRLDAIGLLIACGDFPHDYQIPYLLVSEAEAVALSLAENLGREPMHAADVIEAMQALAAKGASAGDIGVAFGVDALVVKRRLKLAQVSPKLFALYRADVLNTEQMAAFAVCDDQAGQEKAWETLDPWSRKQPAQIRRLLTAQHVHVGTDRLARFVGAKAFVAAGGSVVHDLFGDEDDGYIHDTALLDRLAERKLRKVADRLTREGVPWVDVILRSDDSTFVDYRAVRHAPVAPSSEQQARTDAIAQRLESIDESLAAACNDAVDDDDARDGADGRSSGKASKAEAALDRSALQDERSRLRRERFDLQQSLVQPLASDLALAGAVVTVDRHGEVDVRPRLIRPEDSGKMQTILADNRKSGAKERAGHSTRLLNVLVAQRTAALAAEVAARPDVALVVLTHTLAQQLLFASGARLPVQIELRPSTPPADAQAGLAGQALASRRAALIERIDAAGGPQAMFDWLAQDRTALMDLLAFCVAIAVDTSADGEQWSAPSLQLAGAVQLDMRKWWQATAQDYFQHVPKARIAEVISQAATPQAAMPIANLGKLAAAELAERTLAPMQWLPEPLRLG